MKYYILFISGGTEITRTDAFSSSEERDAFAKKIFNSGKNENLFWADVSENMNLYVGEYTNVFFEEVEDQNCWDTVWY